MENLVNKRIVVSVTNDLSFDQRVKRSCESLTQLGGDVVLIGRLLPNSQPYKPNYLTYRVKLPFVKGAGFYISYQLYLFWKLLFIKADIYFSNDLDTLLPNFLVATLKNKKLVYDTHELFTEVPELKGRWQRKIWLMVEKFIFPKLKNVITVNNSIANIYESKYNVKVNVVRNIPFLQALPPIPKNQIFTVILQGAGINMDRGAEELVEAMLFLPSDVHLKIVGNGDVVPFLKQKVATQNLGKKVTFVSKCSPEELRKITISSHLGVSLDKNTNPNYIYSLPNKLFDYIHAEIPILASPIIEIQNIINQYEVGLILKEVHPKEIAEKIEFLKNNPEIYHHFCQNCKTAKAELNAQKEQEILKKILTNVQ